MLSSACTLFVTSRWSSHLRAWEPGLKDEDVVSIITALDIGAFLAFIPGTCYDAFGCKVVGYAGAVVSLVGYLSLFSLIQAGVHAHVGILCLIGFVIGTGSIWLVICALNTVAGNFEKEDRGRAVGLVMTTFGLSAGIFSELISLVEGAHTQPSLLAFIGVSMASVALVSNVGVARLPEGCLLRAGTARTTEALAVCVAALLLVSLPALARPRVAGVDAVAAVVAVFYGAVLVFQVALVVRLLLRRGCCVLYNRSLQTDPGNVSEHRQQFLAAPEQVGATFGEALRAAEYWLLTLVFLVGVGVGQTLSNSIADIPSIDAAAGIAIFAAGNSIGRFVPGYLSDILLKVCDRSGFVVISTALLCVAQSIMLVAAQHSRAFAYIGIFLTALAFGSYWVLVPAAEAEWFGRRHFGKIHGFLLFIAGDGGVALVYKGTASAAESTRGPCDAPGRVAGCFALKWQVGLGLSCAALLMAVGMRAQRRQAESAAAAAASASPCDPPSLVEARHLS